MFRRLILRTSNGLTFLIHSQHRGSSTQQCLHHRRQSVARCEMQGPGRGGRTEPGLLLTLTPNPGPAQASQGQSRLLPKVVRRCCNKGFRSRTTGNLDVMDNRVDSENGGNLQRLKITRFVISISLWSSLHLQGAVGGVYECGTVDLSQNQQGTHLMSLWYETNPGHFKESLLLCVGIRATPEQSSGFRTG